MILAWFAEEQISAAEKPRIPMMRAAGVTQTFTGEKKPGSFKSPWARLMKEKELLDNSIQEPQTPDLSSLSFKDGGSKYWGHLDPAKGPLERRGSRHSGPLGGHLLRGQGQSHRDLGANAIRACR